MKTKRDPKLVKGMSRKGLLEIRSIDASPERAITELAETVFQIGASQRKEQSSDDAEMPAACLKALISIATNAWRAKTKMVDAGTGEVREDMKRVSRHIEAIYRNLADLGIVIRDHTGDAYDEGQPMKVIASKPKTGLNKKVVGETLLPSVFWNNRLVQNGEVEIATPVTSNISAEPKNV